MNVLSPLIDFLTVFLMLTGAFFFTVGTLGLLRFPDFYCRTHAATKCDTLGAGSVLMGLALNMEWHSDTIKLMVIIALVLISSPTIAHALARAAFRTGLKPWVRSARKGEHR